MEYEFETIREINNSNQKKWKEDNRKILNILLNVNKHAQLPLNSVQF